MAHHPQVFFFFFFLSKSVTLLNTPFIMLPGALPEASKGGGLFGHSGIWTGGSIPMCLKSVCRLASNQVGTSFSK